MSVDDFLKNVKRDYAKNKTEILTGLGLGGFAISTFLFIQATIKAVRKVDARKAELHVDKLAAKEVFRLCWKDYIFPFSTALASTALIVKSDQIKARQTGELVSALMVSRTLLDDYREAVKESVDEDKVEEIEDKAAKSSGEKLIKQSAVEIYPTGYGNELFIENLTGTVFRSCKSRVVQAFAEAERRIYFENYISLNEWRDELGLQGHACGEILGFNQSTNNGKIDYRLVPGDYFGELCWIIQINTEPTKDFDVIYI